ncbi:MAG: ribonuclease H-like domain-containing protein [Planctomycetota bacterium]
MSDTRRQLDELAAGRARRHSAGDPSRPAQHRPALPVRLDEILGGAPANVGRATYWRIDTPFTAVGGTSPLAAWPPGFAWRMAAEARETLDPRRTMLLDIETGGLAGAPVFLIGVVLADQQPLRVLQLLARDYPEEEAILRAVAELAVERDTWVTFNGKSFDEPFLRDRATVHRVPLPSPRVHVDLLHAARRAWRHRVPDCRLVTLEQHILNRPRVGDVSSCDVPDLFHHFMRTGNAAPLRPVLEHNRIDLVSCAELLVRLAETPR